MKSTCLSCCLHDILLILICCNFPLAIAFSYLFLSLVFFFFLIYVQIVEPLKQKTPFIMFTTNNSEYEIFINDDNFIACYHVNRTGDHFQNTNALTTSLPTFVLQLSIVLIFNRLLLLLLKPLKQPPVVAYIIVSFKLYFLCMKSLLISK